MRADSGGGAAAAAAAAAAAKVLPKAFDAAAIDGEDLSGVLLRPTETTVAVTARAERIAAAAAVVVATVMKAGRKIMGTRMRLRLMRMRVALATSLAAVTA